MRRPVKDHRPIRNQPGRACHSEKQCGGERQQQQWMRRAHPVVADLWVVWVLLLAGGGECDPVIYSYIVFLDCCFPNDDACGMNELPPHNMGVGTNLDAHHAAPPYSTIHQTGQDSVPVLVKRDSWRPDRAQRPAKYLHRLNRTLQSVRCKRQCGAES